MSLDMTDFIIQVEETYGFEIPDQDNESLKTVGSLCEYVQKGAPQPDPAKIFDTVRRMISEHFSIPVDEITPESRWIEDLGFG